MASPQLEDGYTRIANEIMEALAKTRIPGEAMQILLVILRKTYGYNKKEDVISLSQFHLATGIIKPSIIRATKLLESMNLISKKAKGMVTSYRFNKNLSTWKPLAKKLPVSEKANNRLLKSKLSLAKKLPTKDKRQKTYKGGDFKKPTISEIADYCLSRNNGIDAEMFYNHYKSNGWKVGKNPMEDWKSAVITWEKRKGQSEKRFDD